MYEYIPSYVTKVVPFDCAHFAKIVTRDTIIAGESERLDKEEGKEKGRFSYTLHS